MLIIGERLNATRKSVRRAVLDRDAGRIGDEARKQADAGANYLDANAGIEAEREPDDLAWLVETIQAAADRPVALDSTNADALRAALPVHKGVPMINSITAEKGRHEDVLPLAKEHDALLVALTVGPDGMPTSADDRVSAARLIVRLVEEYDIPIQNVYFDPVVYSVATSGDAGRIAIESVRRLKTEYPDAHITCGLSNISFGLPRRRVLNRTFLAMLIGAGLDAAILDPTEPGMMSTVLGAEAVVGRDEFCMNYIGAERAGRLN